MVPRARKLYVLSNPFQSSRLSIAGFEIPPLNEKLILNFFQGLRRRRYWLFHRFI
jgi:hypothetical protein